MCRRHQLWGCVLAAFGVGLLVGMWLKSGFFGCCLGIGVIVIGFGMFRRN